MRFAFRSNDVLVIFNHAVSGNRKITGTNNPIVQQYTFSKAQFEVIKGGGKYTEMFDNDQANCLSCPYSKSNGYQLGKCYTHKFYQGVGMKALLQSIIKQYGTFESIPELPETIPAKLLEKCRNAFVRFGTYGETTFVPIGWYDAICSVTKTWTGYTHTWHNCNPAYAKYLMASVHNAIEQAIAAAMGFRSFLIFHEQGNGNVLCPAEVGKVTCNTCSLCSGTSGKGKKSVEIQYH